MILESTETYTSNSNIQSMAVFKSVFVKGNQVTFVSPLSDEEAHTRLHGLVGEGGKLADSEFAKSLVSKEVNALSEKQMNWVHKLVLESFRMTSVVDMITLAISKGKLSKIKWTFDMDGVVVSIKRFSDDHKYHAKEIHILDGMNNKLGWVTQSGFLYSTIKMTMGVYNLLERLAEDPADFVAKYGQVTGNCCFCEHKLDTEDSLAVGYGPKCASHYGLPWGLKTKKTRKAKID